MAQLVYTQLLLNGNPILSNSNYSINLFQALAAHQNLIITCPTEALEDATGMFATNARNFIGQRLSLNIMQGQQKFTGLITDVTVNKYDGADGSLIITAQSPTILLAHGSDSQSYEKNNLNDIIKQATKEYPADTVKIAANAKTKGNINYTVQYKESDFDFLKRLAARYGEWFFYDGELIQFGKLGGELTQLTYGTDLHSFNFSLRTRPQDHTYLAYDLQQATMHETGIQQFNEKPPNPYINHVAAVSKKMYKKNPRSIYNPSLLYNGKIELNDVARLKAKHALNTVFFTGNSEVASVKLGHLISVVGKSVQIPGKEDFYGKYVVTEITHTINSSGEYENNFTGIPRDIKVPPYFNENAVPRCEEQYAVVKNNNDPQGLGRVQVQFPWQQQTNQLTPWVPLVHPHAGAGKGFYFIPEIEEEVVVGFEAGCAEKPFIMGTRYNGSEKSGYNTPDNRIKALHTRSGHILKFTEDESIQLTDKSGNEIFLDTTGANITITAPETVTINAKNINLNAGEDISMAAGQDIASSAAENISESAGADFSLIAANVDIEASDDITKTSKTKATHADSIQTQSANGTQHHSGASLENYSSSKSKNG